MCSARPLKNQDSMPPPFFCSEVSVADAVTTSDEGKLVGVCIYIYMYGMQIGRDNVQGLRAVNLQR